MPDPIELLRAANPVPDCSPLPLAVLEDALSRSGGQRSPRRGLGTAQRAVTVVATGFALGLVGLVLYVAVAATRHPARPQPTAGQAPATLVQGRQDLVDNLSVLRRPQTRTDGGATLPSPFYIPSFLPEPARASFAQRNRAEQRREGDLALDRPLLRLITTSAGDEISVAPETFRPSSGSSLRAEGLAIAIHTPGNSQSVDTGPQTVTVSDFLQHGLAIFNDTRRGGVLVPDGVARVTLTGFGRADGGSITLDSSKIAGHSAVVHDNLASFTMAGLTATSQTTTGVSYAGAGAIIHMIWFNAQGRVIARPTTTASELYVTVHGTATSTPPPAGATPLTLQTTGATDEDATGFTFFPRINGHVRSLTLVADHLPTLVRASYGVWLVNKAGGHVFLGYAPSGPKDGHLTVSAPVSLKDRLLYPMIELTIQHGNTTPSHPGQVILRGSLP